MKFTSIAGVDCFSGLTCACGRMLTPDTLESLANVFEPARQTIEAAYPESVHISAVLNGIDFDARNALYFIDEPNNSYLPTLRGSFGLLELALNPKLTEELSTIGFSS